MQGPRWTERERAARLPKLIERNRQGHAGAFLYEDADWMRDAYITRKLTLLEVAREAGCALRTIARWMKIHGIETRQEWARVSGPAHPQWKGASICPSCGGKRSYGARRTCHKCRERRGDKNPKWRGENIEYAAAHERVVAARGAATSYPCAHCDEAAREWAYDGTDPNARRNQHGRDDGVFSLDVQRYLPLCVNCHRRFDLSRR